MNSKQSVALFVAVLGASVATLLVAHMLDGRTFVRGDANVIRAGKKLAGHSLDVILHDAFPQPQ